MIVRYYQYDQAIPVIEEFIRRVYELRHRYYASELLKKMMATQDVLLDPAIRKAMTICKLLGIPVQDHFTRNRLVAM